MNGKDQFKYELECVMDMLILAGLCFMPTSCHQQEDAVNLLSQCGTIFTQLISMEQNAKKNKRSDVRLLG